MKRYIKSSSTSGFVGIWWILKNSVIADMRSIDDGYNDGYFIHYDENKNHQTEWRKMIKESLSEEEAGNLIEKGYKSIERGRVVYNIRTRCYEIVCSEEVSKQPDLLKKIVEAFDLSGCRYDFIVDHHYHVAEITGNPVLDTFEYGV